MGSDGDSDQASATSSEEVQSPVRVRLRNNPTRKISSEDINKRLSLPVDIRLPDGYLEKFALSSPPFDKPLSRSLRRASLVRAAREGQYRLARAKSIPTKTYSNEVVTLWYRPPDILLGSTDYSTPIDMWGVGCIFYEMSTGRPLFPGSTVEEELHFIFKLLGTPNEETWPRITSNEDFRSYNYPKYRPDSLYNHAPR
ncbi:UNVERIFIED_CONTAM: hypothetical protein FKN15_033819 [Acipenser sinensis]